MRNLCARANEFISENALMSVFVVEASKSVAAYIVAPSENEIDFYFNLLSSNIALLNETSGMGFDDG